MTIRDMAKWGAVAAREQVLSLADSTFRPSLDHEFGGKVRSVGAPELLDSDIYKINWILTRKCNYSCSYCTVYDNVKGFFPPIEDLLRAIGFIAPLPHDDIRVTLSGGEPTSHPKYFEFVLALAEALGKRGSISTITNLSKGKHYYERLGTALAEARSRISFIASYHFDFANAERFIENIRTLVEQEIPIKVSVMPHPERIDEARTLVERMDELQGPYMRYSVGIIREDYGTVPDRRYTKEDLAWLRENHEREKTKNLVVEIERADNHEIERIPCNGNELIASDRNRYKGMLCDAGASMMAIDGDGSISSAVCFRHMPGDKPNIFRDTLESLSAYLKPVVCPFRRCGCLADLQIPKYART